MKSYLPLRLKSSRWKWIVFALGLAASVAVIFYLNVKTPFAKDDFAYMFSFATHRRLHTIGEIVTSLVAHYSQMNGRIVPHFLLQCLLLFPKGVFNVVNTGAYFALVCLIYLHCRGGTFQQFRPDWFFLLQFLLWFLLPQFSHSMLWVSGSATYLYGSVLCLLALQETLIRKPETGGAGKTVWVFLLCLLAGNCGENWGAGLVFFLIAALVRLRIKKRKPAAWHVAGLLGALCGYVILLAAPGQWKRINRVNVNKGNALRTMAFTFLKITTSTMSYFFVLLLALLFLLYLLWKRGLLQAHLADIGLYLLAALASIYVMTPIQILPIRAFTAMTVLLMIAFGRLFCALPWTEYAQRHRAFFASAVLICLAGFCFTFFPARAHVLESKAQYDTRMADARRQMAGGSTELRLEAITSNSRFSVYSEAPDLKKYPGAIANFGLAWYLGAKSVVSK